MKKLFLFALSFTHLFCYDEGPTGISPNRNRLESTAVMVDAHSLPSLTNSHLDHIRFLEKIDLNPIEQHDTHYTTWASFMTHFDHKARTNNSPWKSMSTEAGLAGIDYRTYSLDILGFALGYLHSYYHEALKADQGVINSGFATIYGNISLEHFYLEPALWGIYNQGHNKRNITTSDFVGTAQATIRTWVFQPHLEFGYNIKTRWGRCTPFYTINYPMAWQGSYTETGASPFNAHQKNYEFSSLRNEFGLKLHQAWTYTWGFLFLKQKVGTIIIDAFHKTTKAYEPDINKTFTFLNDYAATPLFAVGFSISASIGAPAPLGIRLTYDGAFGYRKMSNKLQFIIGKTF